MSELLKQAYDSELFRQQGHILIDKIADYLKKTIAGESDKVLPYQNPETYLKIWQEDIDFAPYSGDKLSDFYQNILDSSIHNHHPKYLGHQVTSAAPVSALTDLLASLINTGVGVYEMGSPAVAIEKIVIDKFAEKIGYGKQAEGILTSGGSLGNLTALLAARRLKANYDVWQEGNSMDKPMAFMVSEEAHYCIERAVKIMGLGEQGIIKIPVNQDFQMIVEHLEAYYKNAIKAGIQVIGVIGNACSTATGAYDRLDKIADFCEKYKLWFHVDGAHGGAVIFSEKYKSLAKGIERADSVIIDLHKMLMTSSLCTALVFKNGLHSYQTFAQKAYYLWAEADEKEWFNLGRRTFECTKNAMSLRVYSLLRTYGTDLFRDYVDTLYDLGKMFAQIICQSSDFELAVEPTANILCFRYFTKKANEKELNELNEKIRKILVEDGEYFIVQTVIQGKIYLRTCLMNPFTSQAELKGLLVKIREIMI